VNFVNFVNFVSFVFAVGWCSVTVKAAD